MKRVGTMAAFGAKLKDFAYLEVVSFVVTENDNDSLALF